MKLSEYFADPDVVIRLDGKVVTNLSDIVTPEVTSMSYIENKVHRECLTGDGDVDMGTRCILQTSRGLLSVASAPGKSARTLARTAPREAYEPVRSFPDRRRDSW